MSTRTKVAMYVAALVVLGILRPFKRCSSERAPTPPAPPRVFVDAGVRSVDGGVRVASRNLDDTAVDAAVVAVSAPPSTPRPPSPYEQLAASAVTPDAFDRLVDGKEWAFFPRGVRPCDQEDEAPFVPPGSTEFDRHENEQRRSSVVASLVGTLVGFRGAGRLGAGDSQTVDVERRFELVRSAYDFQRHAFPLSIVARGAETDAAAWPICDRGRCRPLFRRGAAEPDGEGGSEADWQNASRLTLSVAMPEARARTFATDMPVELSFLMRFQGLGYHQRCERECSGDDGDRECSQEERGLGVYYEADLVAYELRVDGEVVASRVPTPPRRGPR